MAASWIAKKAEEYNQREREAQIERELKLHQLSVVDSHWRDVKDSLESVIRRDIEDWNAGFPQDDKRIDGLFHDVVDGFRIKKTRFPAATITITFESNGNIIRCETVRPIMTGGGTYTTTKRFRLRVAPNDFIYLVDEREAHLSMEQISQKLIESITEW